MLFYGDEAGYTNDYSYLGDPGKSYDNRWTHRPTIDWVKNERVEIEGTVEQRIFSGTQRLISIRKKVGVTGDYKNLTWLNPHIIYVAGYLRTLDEEKLYCVFNFSDQTALLTWKVFKEHGPSPDQLFDHWNKKLYTVGFDYEYLIMPPYTFNILEVK